MSLQHVAKGEAEAARLFGLSPGCLRSCDLKGVDRIIKLMETLRVMPGVRSSVKYLPAPLKRWYERHKTRVNVRLARHLVPPRELENTYRDALAMLRGRLGELSLGDYLEFGVYSGTSLACMFRALQDTAIDHVRLIGFDSFEGLPEGASREDDGAWYAGQFRSDLEFTREFLARSGVDLGRVILVKGWFSDTLDDRIVRQHGIAKASVIMVDCDLYSSAKQALRFCAPLIRDQAVVFFDDWVIHGLADKNLGERRAFEEFRTENEEFDIGDFPAYSSTSRGFVLTRKP